MKRKLLLVFTALCVFFLAGCNLLNPTKGTTKDSIITTKTPVTTSKTSSKATEKSTTKNTVVTIDDNKVALEKAQMVTEIISFALENEITNLDSAEKVNLILSDALTTLAKYGVTANELKKNLSGAKALFIEIQACIQYNEFGEASTNLSGINAAITKFLALDINYHAFIEAGLVIAEDALNNMLITLKQTKVAFEEIKKSDPDTFAYEYAYQYEEIIEQISTYERLLNAIQNDKEDLVDAALFVVNYLKDFQGSLKVDFLDLIEDLLNGESSNYTFDQIKKLKGFITLIIEENIPTKEDLETVYAIIYNVFIPEVEGIDTDLIAARTVKSLDLAAKFLKSIGDNTVEKLFDFFISGNASLNELDLIDAIALLLGDINKFYKANSNDLTITEEEITLLIDMVFASNPEGLIGETDEFLKTLLTTLYDTGFDCAVGLLDHLATTNLEVMKAVLIVSGFEYDGEVFRNYYTGVTYPNETAYVTALNAEAEKAIGLIADVLVVIKNNISEDDFKNIILACTEITPLFFNLNGVLANEFVIAVKEIIENDFDAVYDLIVNAINYLDNNSDIYTRFMDVMASQNHFSSPILVAEIVGNIMTTSVTTGLDDLVADIFGLIKDQRFNAIFGLTLEEINELEEGLRGKFSELKGYAELIKDLDVSKITANDEANISSFMSIVNELIELFSVNNENTEYIE